MAEELQWRSCCEYYENSALTLIIYGGRAQVAQLVSAWYLYDSILRGVISNAEVASSSLAWSIIFPFCLFVSIENIEANS